MLHALNHKRRPFSDSCITKAHISMSLLVRAFGDASRFVKKRKRHKGTYTFSTRLFFAVYSGHMTFALCFKLKVFHNNFCSFFLNHSTELLFFAILLPGCAKIKKNFFSPTSHFDFQWEKFITKTISNDGKTESSTMSIFPLAILFAIPCQTPNPWPSRVKLLTRRSCGVLTYYSSWI